VGWLLFVSGALATFRLSHLVSKERGPLSVFERIRNALPGGSGVGSGMGQLHFLFFSTRKRYRLRASLDQWFASHAVGMGSSLARLQCGRPNS
jgi:hypothetical protein